MTKRKDTERLNTPTRPLKDGHPAADLVAFESYGFGKLPTLVGRGLSEYDILFTELEPLSAVRVQDVRLKLEAAERTQSADDAEAVSKAARKGVDGFGDLVEVLRGVDSVAVAQAEVALAERTYKAVKASTVGTLTYLNRLAGGESRADLLAMLNHAWQGFVIVNPESTWTLGQLATANSAATTARELIGRLLIWVEGQNAGRSIGAAQLKQLRIALTEDYDTLPTLEFLEQRAAEEAANTPEAQARAEAERVMTKVKAENEAYAAESAQFRRGLGREDNDTENSGEAA